jgi:transposase
MFFPETHVRVWLYNRPTDMRKSYDGLSALVKNVLHEDPSSGHVFVFINRKRTQMKVLYFDRSGYCIWSKRLERGRFQNLAHGEDKQQLDWTRLKLLLEGIDLNERRRYKRYTHTQHAALGV